MKFITEYDLRSQFNAQPFTNYQLEEGVRLTPGARTFLSDRGINVFADGTAMRFGKKAENLDPKSEIKEGVSDQEADTVIKRYVLAAAKLDGRLEVLQSEYFLAAGELINSEEIESAEKVVKLARSLENLRDVVTGKASGLTVHFESCAGINQENCGKDIGNCFTISEFYIQGPHGTALLIANRLRALTREVRIQAVEVMNGQQLISVENGLNQIINQLSQIICTAGVKECKRNQ